MEPPHLFLLFLFLFILYHFLLLIRQVCEEWNLLILGLWRNPAARARLEARLRAGWRSSTNTAMQLGLARRQVAGQSWLGNYIQDLVLFVFASGLFNLLPSLTTIKLM